MIQNNGDDGWETTEWVVQQDDRKSSLGALTHGLASRVNPQPVELSIEDVPLVGLDRLEQAVGDLVVCFDEGYLEIDDMTETTDTAEAAHVTTHRVHLTLRRSEWNLAENAAAAAVALVSRDTVTGLTRALNLLHKLTAVSHSLTAAERNAVSKVLTDQWRGTATQRGDVTDHGIDVQKLIETGILVETDEGLSVAA